MAEHEIHPTAEPEKEEPSRVYIWDYNEQARLDTAQAVRNRRRGVFTYAIVMTVVFAVCFALLIGTLLWKNPFGSDRQTDAGIPTTQIAERSYPATVLVTAQTTSGVSFGTGFFIRSDGYIATNFHVISGAAQIEITLYSGQNFQASVVGYHAASDLAVLKIGGFGYPVIPTGNSDLLRAGERAVAIGHPEGAEAAWTVTQGIISATNRIITVSNGQQIVEMTMIQTDAPVNPGNSGGPLCNGNGEVVGIVTRKLTDTESIGFAIPINGAMEILNAIIMTGDAEDVDSSITKIRPTLGIYAGSIEKGKRYTYGGNAYVAKESGVFIQTVERDGASFGILQPFDIITHFGGERVATMDELLNLLYKYKVGDVVLVTVLRENTEVQLEITLGKP